MKLYLIFLSLVLTFSNAQDIKNLKSGVNTFGFQPNMGQVGDFEGKRADDVFFFTRNNGIDLFFRSEGVSYVIRSYEFKDEKVKDKIDEIGKEFLMRKFRSEENSLRWARIDLNLLNGDIDESRIEYDEQLPGYTNYYLSHCPDGILFVPSYRVVRIKDVYPGIDWIWRIGENGVLHHEFEVRDGADVKEIKFEVRWADVELVGDGRKLKLRTPVGEIEDGELAGYADDGEVELRYLIDEAGILSFDVRGDYRGKLLIDPPLARLWATYYGGSDWDAGFSITTDANGNVFVTGVTWSTDFPTYNPGGGAYFQGTNAGYSDAFILKFEGGSATRVEDKEEEIPRAFVLYQNYPNPFNPGTKIIFDLPESGNVKVEVFNLLGERVAILYDGFMEAGYGRTIRWDAFGFPGGVYFCRVSLNNRYVDVKKMVLVR